MAGGSRAARADAERALTGCRWGMIAIYDVTYLPAGRAATVKAKMSSRVVIGCQVAREGPGGKPARRNATYPTPHSKDSGRETREITHPGGGGNGGGAEDISFLMKVVPSPPLF